MSWTSRSTAPIGKTLALAAMVAVGSFAAPAPARADATFVATYRQETIRFTRLTSSSAGMAVSLNDPGFAALLRATGAALTWRPGDRYVLVTTSQPLVVSFALGDRRYDVGPIPLQAAFAPYQQGDDVYLSFDAVLRALDLMLRADGSGTAVLQPQLASLDVLGGGTSVTLAAHGGAPLRARIVSQSPTSIVYEFAGVGTTLAGSRAVNSGGVRSVDIADTGSIRDPKTTVTVSLAPGTSAQPPRSDDGRDIVLAFSNGAPPPQAVAQQPAPAAPPAGAQAQAPAAAGPTTVTGVSVQPDANGYTVTIAVSGNAQYEWHRLRDPDNRFWVDIKGAQLAGGPIDQTEPDPINSLRVRQIDPQTVRVALSLNGQKGLAFSPSATGLAVAVGRDNVADAPRSGGGSVGNVVSAGEQTTALVTPAPYDESGFGSGGDDANGWKFGPRSTYVPTNPRLIVIDPGHGGSDTGAARGGVTEASLALDMSKRLRDLLVARGWQVRMTRDTDVDVYAPNDSAHDELQARVDVANNAGARMFISIHANSFINSGPYGTTCYVSKTNDLALGRIMERQLRDDGTKDDGTIKSHLYVTMHTLMPAVLIETAFLSNPNDFALLTSPAWRQQVAQSIADGVDRYAQAYPVAGQAAQ